MFFPMCICAVMHSFIATIIGTVSQCFSPEVIFGIHSRTFGYQEKFKQRSLFLMNHVCHFDWLFFWGVVERSGDTTCWKAIAKDMIKKVPLVGRWLHTYTCLIPGLPSRARVYILIARLVNIELGMKKSTGGSKVITPQICAERTSLVTHACI